MSETISRSSPAPTGSPDSTIADRSAIRLLAVDDNEALRYSVVRSLREAGYQVKEARTGQEALVLAAEIPDLILLDVNLPDMHGFEICKRIKSNPTTAHIPVLHVSATFVDPEARIEGLSSGADAYLVEPIDRGELVATVGALLRLKNAEILARQQAMIADNARQELAQLNATLEKRVTERTAELKQANDSLKELSARILEMQDEERKRIARELHDSVGQLLAAITMNNAFIFSEASKLTAPSVKALNENETIVQEILRGIRTMSHLLHPPLLDEAGLRSALQWYVDEFGDRSGISVVLECDPSVGRLPGNLETAIFRIVQECLGNVHRHSGSATAVIRLKIDGDRVNLEVSDQGNGISPEKREEMKSGFRAGVGLRSMHERVAQFQGELQIHSGSGGTTVTAMFPNQPTVYAETV